MDFFQYPAYIALDEKGLFGNGSGPGHPALIDADIGGLGVFRCHPPKGVFDDAWRIVAYPQLQEKHPLPLVMADEFAVALGRLMPAWTLGESVIRTEIHGHGPATDRTSGNQFRGNPHILLLGKHAIDPVFVLIGCLTARQGTLE